MEALPNLAPKPQGHHRNNFHRSSEACRLQNSPLGLREKTARLPELAIRVEPSDIWILFRRDEIVEAQAVEAASDAILREIWVLCQPYWCSIYLMSPFASTYAS